MGIEVASSFTRMAAIPIDDRFIVADITARDAIDAGVRYEGMFVFVVSEGLNYQLVGGITDGDWAPFAGAGGGGIGTIKWDIGPIAPNETRIYNRFRAFVFDDASKQLASLESEFTVPSSYNTGDPITLRLKLLTEDAAGDVRMRVTSRRYRPLTDQLDTLPYVHTSTAVAVNVPTTAKQAFYVDLDLTDGSGMIDAGDVEPGDVIQFELVKYDGTSVGDLYFLYKHTEVLFA